MKSEDGAWSKTDKNEFFFNSTGGLAGNLYGRTYRLNLNEHGHFFDSRPPSFSGSMAIENYFSP